MNRIKWGWLALAFCMSSVQAEPANVQSVEKLLQLTNGPVLARSMRASVEPMLRNAFQQSIGQQAGGKKPTSAQQQAMGKLDERFNTLMNEEFSWEKLKPQIVQMYAQTFEQKEVDDIIAFYQTPSGQALLRKTPMVMNKTINGSQQILQTITPRAQQLVVEALGGR